MNFSRRVIFPIYDLDGDMMTFQGRDVTGQAERKYLFPAGLPGTSRFLYNGVHCQRKSHVVMNEGVMDVIATFTALRETHPEIGVVGSFGIELSTGRDGADQVSRLLDMKDQGLRYVTIMWDGEKGAFEKALKAAKIVRSIGLGARIALLPAGQDPGESDPRDIRKAFDDALAVDNTSALRLRLQNPYR
jgi:DNA primase